MLDHLDSNCFAIKVSLCASESNDVFSTMVRDVTSGKWLDVLVFFSSTIVDVPSVNDWHYLCFQWDDRGCHLREALLVGDIKEIKRNCSTSRTISVIKWWSDGRTGMVTDSLIERRHLAYTQTRNKKVIMTILCPTLQFRTTLFWFDHCQTPLEAGLELYRH